MVETNSDVSNITLGDISAIEIMFMFNVRNIIDRILWIKI